MTNSIQLPDAPKESPYPQAGAVWGWRDLPDGRTAWVFPMLFTARLGVGLPHALVLDDFWCYDDPAAAVAAMHAWDGEGEPDGWHRHPPSGRRRPNGDRTQEHIAP